MIAGIVWVLVQELYARQDEEEGNVSTWAKKES